MVSKRSIASKHVEDGGEERALNKGDEEPLRESEGGGDSDSATEDDGTAAVVPLKKPKLGPSRLEPGSGPGEDGSECSSPSASAFIIMPSSKPREKKRSAASKKFSEEEEIALLKGLAAFWANGRNNKWTEFHQFVKGDLPREFTKIQVSEKIRGLKRKFDTNMEKARASGGSLDIADRHESVLFELSKRLWGDEKGIVNTVENGQDEVKIEGRKTLQKEVSKFRKHVESDGYEEKEALKKHKQSLEICKEEFPSEFPLLYSSFDGWGCPKFVKHCCHLIGREKAQELEEKWRELNAEEICLEAKRIELTKKGFLKHHTSK